MDKLEDIDFQLHAKNSAKTSIFKLGSSIHTSITEAVTTKHVLGTGLP